MLSKLLRSFHHQSLLNAQHFGPQTVSHQSAFDVHHDYNCWGTNKMNIIRIIIQENKSSISHRTNKCEVFPKEAVQCIFGVEIVADPFVGLVRIVHRLFERVSL